MKLLTSPLDDGGYQQLICSNKLSHSAKAALFLRLVKVIGRIALLLAAATLASAQQINVLGVTSAGGFEVGLTPSGGISSVFLTGLQGIPPLTQAQAFPLPLSLAGVQVQVNGFTCPVIAVADTGAFQQINFQAVAVQPPGTNNNVVTVIQTTSGLPRSASLNGVGISQSVFFVYPNGNAIIQRPADSSLITPENPARPGDILVLYATGLGQEIPAVPPGEPTPIEPLSRVPNSSLTVGGISAQLLYVGLTPGLAGVNQINFIVPDGVSPGDVDLVFRRAENPFFDFTSKPAKIRIR